MPLPKDILNELKWRDDRDLSKAEIWYIHRGAPSDTKIISGRDITNLEHSYIVLSETPLETRIPYHRIFKIYYNGKLIFEREKK